MQRARPRDPDPAPDSASRSPGAIVARELSPRVRALLAQRDRLLRSIARKQAEIARLTGRVEDTSAKLGAELPAVMQEVVRLSRSLENLFDGLLRDPARSRRERKAVKEVYAELRRSGLLSGESEIDELDAVFTASPDEGEGRARPPQFVEPAAVGAATSSSGSPARALFRRLADALHPDKVQDEGEKARRTEIMKEVTQAYQSGDYARLLDIERSQGASLEALAERASDEQEAQLTRTNAALRKQSRGLDKELRALRAAGADELDVAFEQARRAVDALRTVHDFVARFRDRQIDLAAFEQGPPDLDVDALRSAGPFDDEPPDWMVDAVEEALADLSRPSRGGPGGRRGRQRG